MSGYTFLIEKSRTRIYQRIVNSFHNALTQQGHRVVLIDPTEIESYHSYLEIIETHAIDYCLITNSRGFISTYVEAAAAFVFELTDVPLIFVHHDNFLSDLHDLQQIHRKLASFHSTRDRSYHFCLEYHNFLDLRSLGIQQVYPIYHASEFAAVDKSDYAHEVTFVGHVLPSLGDNLENMPCSHLLRADYWNRIAKFDYKMEPSAIAFAEAFPHDISTDIDRLAAKYFYLSMLHLHSQFSRGDVIRRIYTGQVDIIGGDPAYLHGKDYDRKIEKSNVRYFSPTADYNQTQNIYARSKINLNITSLQFDQAVINRVLDAGAVGGFVLTDWKPDLEKITTVASEISYRTIDELNHKIGYYLHPDHESERLEIADVLYHDIQRTCTYPIVVDFILSKLGNMTPDDAQPIKIDLGCGPWKAAGFIGVDIAPGQGVDVVADLSQRFPFADSSVDLVRAYDVIEHLENRIHTMNEIWRICKPNGLVDIRVPSTDGRGAFQDPTHVSFWNINSFRYYSVEFPSYLKLCHIYGFKGAFNIEALSEEGTEDGVVHVKAVLRAIKDTTENIVQDHKLRAINLLACPDWQQPEEIVLQDLANLLQAVMPHPDRNRMTLLITTDAIDPEEADAAITTVLMHLMAEEGLEISETGPEISLVSLNSPQGQALIPFISARVVLSTDVTASDSEQVLAHIPAVKLTELTEIEIQEINR